MHPLTEFFNQNSSVSQYGDDSLATKEAIKTGILADLKGIGGDLPKDAMTIIEALEAALKGEPIDDKKLMMEKMIQLVSAMPRSSKNRTIVTGKLIDQLWGSLQHPPLQYVGDKFQYRQADGSYNNIMSPDLGKAGMPYARSVRGEKMTAGAKPDPGLLFDLLMSRGDAVKENPAGLSSMLFYHASIIIHDVFRTNRKDPTISDTSSYLDLSPLYGKNLEEVNEIRTLVGGRIKPDTFAEKRLLGLPPGICVMLVMYSRFHNHVVEKLATINEGGRFSLNPRLPKEAAEKKQDEDLFQTGRLVTCGLYISISLHDYIRGIGNLNHSTSDWTLDPRVEIGPSVFDKDGTPRGIGNQVSCEFNLLYRFHSGVSKRDEKWTEDFYRELFPVSDTHKLTMPQLMEGLAIFEKHVSEKPPHERTFGGMKRQADGSFDDADLVKILKESIEDPAGAFGANNVPDILKQIEVLGIKQARNWQVATLNEFRNFFGLQSHKTFADINSDPYVAETLQKLYDHPDLVELYPGLFLEETKPRMDPGMGLCGPYTVTRAVFSDAVTLVRSDRFYTLDYTPQNLTAWGITEVAPDYECMGGAKMSMLILNAFPKWFKYNSVYALQPFFTPKESKSIFTKFGTTDKYSFEPPSLEKDPIPILSHTGVKTVLKDTTNFNVPWGPAINFLMEGTFCLAFDGPQSVKQHQDIVQALFALPDYQAKFKVYTEEIICKLLQRESYTLGKN
ncbi:heme peroxidase, partial [Trichophaea hybrida]